MERASLVRRFAGMLVVAAVCLSATDSSRAADAPAGESPILQQLKHFNELGSILMVAAHPDDENTQLLTYAARGPGYRTAYLSLTRGDGGQNLLGPEFGAELGLIRTEELLAARRLDGAQQFFTRALDFGYSKTPEETLKIWDHAAVLGDVVRVIRTFRPDVMVTVFSPTAGNTHGHHTASAILAVEAFKLAGDAKSYPEQLTGPGALTVWQPKRIMMNVRGGPGGGAAGQVRMDIGGTDPVLGIGFGAIAAQSRAMHKTQGFGQTPAGGARAGGGTGPNMQGFALLDGAPATTGLFDGVDTTWGRFAGGADIEKMTELAIAAFDAKKPEASVPALLGIHKKLITLKVDPVVEEKKQQLDRILQQCLGLTVETTVENGEVVPGENFKIKLTVRTSSTIPMKFLADLPNDDAPIDMIEQPLKADEPKSVEMSARLPKNALVSQPYWLREESKAGVFVVKDATLIGRPENPPAYPVNYTVTIQGQTLAIWDEPVQIIAKPGVPEVRRRLEVIAPVSLKFASDVRVFSPGSTKAVEVEVTGYRANSSGVLKLDLPTGWNAAPESQAFNLAVAGDKANLTFNVTAPTEATVGMIGAHAEVGGAMFTTARKEINYAHIPPLLLQPPAVCKAVSLDLAIKGKTVAYLPGAGDSVAEAIGQMGYAVTQVTGADLTPEKLKSFDAVVVGIRAMNTRTDLAASEQGLFDYAAAGGTVIVQYNTPGNLKARLAPFNLTLSNNLPANRVDEEDAKITLLLPDHPAFNTPNKIVPADFDGWVQERGLDFPSDWDADHFIALLACSDTGEPPLKGGLLVAKTGKGYFVYTGLAWFRQLPAGVPGAYRLFANLISLGK